MPSYTSESGEWFIDDRPGFPAVVWFVSTPTLLPLPSVSSTGDTQEDRRVADGGGGRGSGWARSQIIQQRESLVLYKSCNILCLHNTSTRTVLDSEPDFWCPFCNSLHLLYICCSIYAVVCRICYVPSGVQQKYRTYVMPRITVICPDTGRLSIRLPRPPLGRRIHI